MTVWGVAAVKALLSTLLGSCLHSFALFTIGESQYLSARVQSVPLYCLPGDSSFGHVNVGLHNMAADLFFFCGVELSHQPLPSFGGRLLFFKTPIGSFIKLEDSAAHPFNAEMEFSEQKCTEPPKKQLQVGRIVFQPLAGEHESTGRPLDFAGPWAQSVPRPI